MDDDPIFDGSVETEGVIPSYIRIANSTQSTIGTIDTRTRVEELGNPSCTSVSVDGRVQAISVDVDGHIWAVPGSQTKGVRGRPRRLRLRAIHDGRGDRQRGRQPTRNLLPLGV